MHVLSSRIANKFICDDFKYIDFDIICRLALLSYS